MGPGYKRLNTVSNGLFDAPSMSRTGLENFDSQSDDQDMNQGGSPSNFPGNVLHDPSWDKYFDMVHDAAGDRNVKFGPTRGSSPSLGNDPNWWAQGLDPNGSAQAIQNAIPPSLRGLYKAGQ